MKNYVIKSCAFTALFLLLISLGCSANYGGKTRVKLHLNLQNSVASKSDKSLMDRFMNFFATEAKAAAPTNLTSVTLKISGPDMQNIVSTYTTPIPSSIDVEVPSGNGRVFEVTAQSDTFYYGGTATQDLTENIDTTVDITMGTQYSPVTLATTFSGTAPTNVTSYEVSVQISGVTLLPAQAFTPGTAIQVPSGPLREIYVKAFTPSETYRASSTQNLTWNQALDLPMTLAIDNTNVVIAPSFLGSPVITSYTVTVTLADSTVLVATQAFTPNTPFMVPSGLKRIFTIYAYSDIGSYVYTTTLDLDVNLTATIIANMTMEYTNVAITPLNSLGTPAGTLTYTVTVTTTAGTVLPSQAFVTGTAFPVPSGSARDFEILINTPSATLRGTLTGQTLTAGGTSNLTIPFSLYQTKILVPDYQNSRIVQIDSLPTGTATWLQRVRTDIGYTSDTIFKPRDICFDSIGRLYIANDTTASAGGAIVMRIDNITSTTYTQIIPSNMSGIDAMAIDVKNNFIYYYKSTGGVLLKRTNIDGTGSLNLTTTGVTLVNGLAVDDNGMLLMAYQRTTPYYAGIYNPSSQTFITEKPIATGEAWHIMFRAPNIYVAVVAGSANNQIMQFDATLTTQIAGYGNYYFSTTPAVGDFYGARRFLAVRPSGFIIADDGTNMAVNVDRLVSMDDMTGTNWTTYGTEGPGTGQFSLLYFC